MTFWYGSIPLTNGSGMPIHNIRNLRIRIRNTSEKSLKVQNRRNQRFSSCFCLMMEGSGAGSLLMTSGSGCGSGCPKTFGSYGSGFGSASPDPDPQHWKKPSLNKEIMANFYSNLLVFPFLCLKKKKFQKNIRWKVINFQSFWFHGAVNS